jgi:hypothetical protein
MKKDHEIQKDNKAILPEKPFPNPPMAPLLTIHKNSQEAEERRRIARNLTDGHPLITRAIQNK